MVFLLCCYAKYHFLKNSNPKNQIILFLFYQPTNPFFFCFFCLARRPKKKHGFASCYTGGNKWHFKTKWNFSLRCCKKFSIPYLVTLREVPSCEVLCHDHFEPVRSILMLCRNPKIQKDNSYIHITYSYTHWKTQ